MRLVQLPRSRQTPTYVNPAHVVEAHQYGNDESKTMLTLLATGGDKAMTIVIDLPVAEVANRLSD